MTVTAENTNHADILGGQEFGDCGAIEMGTVGWDDGSDYVDQGSATNDGNTLVKVQLFRGRDPSQPLKPGVAQGHKIVAQISSMFGIYWIPPAGTRVQVSIPAGMRETVGAALIIGAYAQSPTQQFAKDRVMWDVGSSTHIVERAKSVVLQSYASPNPQYLAIGTPRGGGAAGAYLMDETGAGMVVQSGNLGVLTANAFIQLKNGEVDIATGGGTAGATWTGGNVTLFGANGYFYTAGVYLGAGAIVTTPCVYMNSGTPAASTKVYIAA